MPPEKTVREPAPRDVASLSFEEALGELEKIVQMLERGQAPLEDSIALYERGTALKSHCEGKLKAAQARIDKIVVQGGAATGTEPFDAG